MSYSFRFKGIQHELFDVKALQSSADHDPVGLLKNCRKYRGDLKTGIRRLNWQHWVACYAGAQGIRQQPEMFEKLLEDDYFINRTYKADFNDLLRLALLIGTDADVRGATYKTACHIALRLQPLFDAEVEPKEVLKRIESAGGLKCLDVPEVVARTRQADDEGVSDDAEDVGLGNNGDEEADDSATEPGDDQEDGDDEPPASPTTARSPARSESSRRCITRPRSTKARGGQGTGKQAPTQPKQAVSTSDHVTREVGDGMAVLEVEVTQEMLSKVLNASYSMLYVKCASLDDGWQRVVGVTVASSD